MENGKKPQKNTNKLHQKWWYIPVLPALQRQKQEDCEFEPRVELCSEVHTSLAYTEKPVSKNKKVKENKVAYQI
jgi:hypothetical protein